MESLETISSDESYVVFDAEDFMKALKDEPKC
jgi:hypothetical protein